MLLEEAPSDVAFTMTDHARRERGDFDEPCVLGQVTVPQGGSPRSTYCEDSLALAYRAPGPSGRLTFNTNGGGRENLWVDAPPPPRSLEFCMASDGECTGCAMDVPVTNLSLRFAVGAGVGHHRRRLRGGPGRRRQRRVHASHRLWHCG
ncbi:MAG: hypothetical protein ACRD0G_18380 [Acidimicrobiales bacterium]